MPGAQFIGKGIDAGGLAGHLPHYAVEVAGAALPAVPVPGSGAVDDAERLAQRKSAFWGLYLWKDRWDKQGARPFGNSSTKNSTGAVHQCELWNPHVHSMPFD